jgi:protein SCO1/2
MNATDKKRLILPAAAFLVGLVALTAALFVVAGPGERSVGGIGGPFALTNQDGRRVSDRDFAGAPFLVFFGFTHCPDVCPTALFEVSEVLRNLGSDGDRVRALFVTVDPERDTPAVLKDYLSSFDPRLTGLTGDAEAIASMTKGYRVYYRKVPTDGGGYTMDHTALVYLMDKEGRFVAPFNLKRKPEEAAADLRRYF